MGDPAGIGPEVVAKALAHGPTRGAARWVVVGSRAVLDAACATLGLSPAWSVRPWAIGAALEPALAPRHAGDVTLLDMPAHATPTLPRCPTALGGRASLDFVHGAIAMALDGATPGAWRPDAIVTAPISKEAWVLAGESRYPGHTELFADAFASPRSAMMFAASPREAHAPLGSSIPAGLHVILASAHVPLARVAGVLTTQRVREVIALGTRTMQRLGVAHPRVGVCGLNPHAGEHGVLGSEDDAVIKPAIEQARLDGIDASGPIPADTIFAGALAWPGRAPARFDLVVAMYHDQGLIPLKLVAFDRAVNLTVGLERAGAPFWRTSPDHGTAYDIAGKGVADAGSMIAACGLAARLAH